MTATKQKPERASASETLVRYASLELPRLLERMHRHYLDLLSAELARLGVGDLTAAQAFLLLDIGEEEVGIQDLINRGHYVSSNALYNIRKLVEAGYFEQTRAATDRRVVRVKLTGKAQELCTRLAERQRLFAEQFVSGDERAEELEAAYRLLRRLERAWDERIRYGDESV